MKTSGWGRYPEIDCTLHHPRDEASLSGLLSRGPVIARGNGRSYGDSALNASNTIDMRGFNRMLEFNAAQGLLVAEAGVLLSDIIETFLPRGWFPAVTPGTRFVTLGGMIASDVHGKNHHRDGSIRQFIDWIDLMGADGKVLRIDRQTEGDLFQATIGGMGLTGIILRASMRLKPVTSGWIRERIVPANNLSELIQAFDRGQDATYSVAWIDCLARGKDLGRGLLTLGEHAEAQELASPWRNRPFDIPRRKILRVPFDAPGFALNRWSVRAFNSFYWLSALRKLAISEPGEHFSTWEKYFYPLDALRDWNRIYGKRGFVQFQCVLPLDRSEAGLSALLERISENGLASFLAVLKRLGPETNTFSFPMEGFTLALDFPMGPRTLPLLEDLDRIALSHGGRFYLTKDSRMSDETLRGSDPRLDRFVELRRQFGCEGVFSSHQSERLKL